jgi:anti-anti-sigma regulatory factor
MARSKLTLNIETREGYVTLTPEGMVDEDSALENYFDDLDGIRRDGIVFKSIAFDLSKITHMNSCGIREWVMFMERVQALNVPYFVVNMNELFVEQLSMISNLLGKAKVPILAFEIPYYCAKCDVKETKTFKTTDVTFTNGEYQAPAATCEKCSGPLDLDAIAEEYFVFIERMK